MLEPVSYKENLEKDICYEIIKVSGMSVRPADDPDINPDIKSTNVEGELKNYVSECNCRTAIINVGQKLSLAYIEDMCKHCDKWLLENKENPNPYKLTDDERYAIVAYSFGITLLEKDHIYENQIEFYRALGNSLRARSMEDFMPWKPYLYYFMSALEKFPLVSTTVFRGISGDYVEKVKQKYINSTITLEWAAFTSTSANIDVAKKFFNPDTNNLVFEIQCLNGRKILEYSIYPDEDEILLLPNTRLIVVEVAKYDVEKKNGSC